MEKLIPLAMVVIAVSVLAIAAQLLLRPCCCPQPTTAVTQTQMFDSVALVPGDTVTLVPGDSLVRTRPGQARLVIPPNRSVLIPAR